MFFRKGFATKYPTVLDLKLTNRCNLSCEICGQAANRKNGRIEFLHEDLCFEDIKRFFDPVKIFFDYVYLWGGEPFLHRDLTKFIDYFAFTSRFCEISTNGLLLYENAENLIQHKIDSVIVSLDGPPEIHDKIRGKTGCFDKAIAGIKKLSQLKTSQDKKPLIRINCVICEFNQSHLLSFVKEIIKLPISSIVLQFPTFTTAESCRRYEELLRIYCQAAILSTARGFLRSYPVDTKLISDQIKQILALYKEKVSIYQSCINSEGDIEAYFNAYPKKIGRRACNLISNGLVIEPNGDVVACLDFPDVVLGNLKDGFISVWHNKLRKSFWKMLRTSGGLPICNRCCQFLH